MVSVNNRTSVKDSNCPYCSGKKLLKGENDLQTLYFEKGSYIIQIVADDYTEDIISLNYNVKIEN